MQLPIENGVLVCLGGADPNNDTLRVLHLLEERKTSGQVRVILGGAYAYHEELAAFAASSSLNLHCLSRLTATEMRQAMEQSHAIICSPSTVAYEAMAVGRPVYLLPIADNQAAIYAYFVQQGLGMDFITAFPVLEERRLKQLVSQQARHLDGRSGERLRTIFLELLTRN